ncbi:TraB/GumN family protein [Sphingomonas sp. KRR8]|uniref:TraB/GumN family protein n=1 Tax=Sphingomonas sp. KRR8 TaxID=2942996 RepID=UPI0020207305|nr:TraB/GumN family protein [Sphingomonas sp. KRR8]URD61952.1 TraB/GumN family protein [Sphingomonas sp. KRR8]
MRLKTLFRRGLAALGLAATAVACTSATTSAAPAAAPRPALWRVADNDTTIYLFGTIHLLPKNYQWRTPKFDQALTSANGLVVETIIDPKNLDSFRAAFTQLAISPGQPPLVSRVPADKVAALQAAVRASGVPMEAYDRMETWAAAFTLITSQFQQIGLQGEDGVEMTLRDTFTSAGKPIGQLETNAEQFSYFDRLPDQAQRDLLLSALEDPAAARKEFDGMLASWTRGDVKGMARSFNGEMDHSPALKDALLVQRNRNWAGWVERRMAQPGTVFVAVGAGHLAGPESVLAMLQKRGLRVTRVQ